MQRSLDNCSSPISKLILHLRFITLVTAFWLLFKTPETFQFTISSSKVVGVCFIIAITQDMLLQWLDFAVFTSHTHHQFMMINSIGGEEPDEHGHAEKLFCCSGEALTTPQAVLTELQAAFSLCYSQLLTQQQHLHKYPWNTSLLWPPKVLPEKVCGLLWEKTQLLEVVTRHVVKPSVWHFKTPLKSTEYPQTPSAFEFKR